METILAPFIIDGANAPAAAPSGPYIDAPIVAPAISGVSFAPIAIPLRTIPIFPLGFMALYTMFMDAFPASDAVSIFLAATFNNSSGDD